MRLKLIALMGTILLATQSNQSDASEFPVTVESCGRTLTFDAAPQRAVVHDLNMSEIMFALELQPRKANSPPLPFPSRRGRHLGALSRPPGAWTLFPPPFPLAT